MGDWGSERSRNGGVDEIPVPGVPGRLWLCGKHFIGPDPDAAVTRVGASVVVCLNEVGELRDRYPAYVAWLGEPERHPGVDVRWVPTPDLHVPAIAVARDLLATVAADLADGASVLVHCGAGIGRAGTIAAGVLVLGGASVADAVATVAAHRPMAGPEAGAQRDLLEALAAS